MNIDIKPVIIFIGSYGSGKTEVAVNFAVNRLAVGVPVQIGDLDLVNPYFRSREAIEILEARGIEVVVPERYLLDADLPVLVPQIKGIIEKPKGVAILDVGGEDAGATVLGSFFPVLNRVEYDMLQVVNAMRPFTDTVVGCEQATRSIEKASRARITGVVGNTHLMDRTDADTIREGYTYAKDVARVLDVPLVFITCETRLLTELDAREFDCPVLPITRQLLPPWRRRQNLGSQNFLLS